MNLMKFYVSFLSKNERIKHYYGLLNYHTIFPKYSIPNLSETFLR